MRISRTRTLLALWLAGAVSLPALAQEPATPTTTAASVPDGELQATITAVEGIVQVRENENAPWQAAKAGMTLGAGAEFRTGPRSAVQFEIPPDQVVTLDRLGVVKLMEAIKSQQKITTDLGMKYGRVRYDIEAAGLEHNSMIHSPGSALAVRGTKVSLYDQPPFAPQAISLTGRAEFRNARRKMVPFGGKGKGTTSIDSSSTSAAQRALVNSTLNSPVLQRQEQQLREMTYLFTHQGRILAGNVAISTRPVTDAELPSLLSGNLDFVLRWGGPNSPTEDLNIIVNLPGGKTIGNPPFVLSLFPDNPQVAQILKTLPQSVPGLAQVGLNSIGPAGFEAAAVGPDIPKGTYVVGAYNFVYQDKNFTPTGPKTRFTIEVFLHGQRVPLVTNLSAVLTQGERPEFGLVYRDAIAVGELGVTALQIPPTSGIATAKRAADVTRIESSSAPAPAVARPKTPSQSLVHRPPQHLPNRLVQPNPNRGR